MKVKRQIQKVINEFNQKDLFDAGISLFKTLGYNTERQNLLDNPTYEGFYNNYIEVSDKITDIEKFKEKAHVQEWKRIELLFQLTDSEMSNRGGLFGTEKVNDTLIEAYLFFAIELTGNNYTRTVLSSITRQINKIFPMPAMVLFKYNNLITLSVIKRRINEKDESKDVLKKVTLIKDINFVNPHRAHIEILFDLNLANLRNNFKITNFVELQNAWQKTLDTKELNKKFYQELSNWYFWAMDKVSFPDDIEKNKDIRNSTNLIRLITRIIFIWFIKEKNLVPDTLFDKSFIKKILKEFLKDKYSNSYYRAILQNLFFGTLNQKMGERIFAKEGSFHDHKKEYGVKNIFRYANLFAIDKKEVLNLFKDIPFLNGGLFDCLDKPDDSSTIIYIDGFSRKPGKQANIPDFLFFADEQEIDLNNIYGTKNKKYKVKGLINILSNYKFTVTENTPVEEEIALDPELLGKVFENLLASYNPETQATARKQTGSFYTPREIVNYMVDESLKVYLKQKLIDQTDIKSEEADIDLYFLFEYNEQDHLFNEKQTKVLIDAIDTCKILDPACGSGAFPMGILHKFVHILHKLDPKNEQWKERQIQKANQIDDVTIREHLITDIESAFTNNELDYGRKLYLIENCIYGVDIQPIAAQIAKLRFFISLVVDQKKKINKENLGIRALPNLETKFVAANTLIGLDKEKNDWLSNQEIIQLKNDLKNIRHQYFSAKTRKEKLLTQKKDKDLRRKIKSILIEIQQSELSAKINNSKEMLEIRYYDEMIKRFNTNQKKRTEFETKRQKLSEKLDKIKKSFTSSSEKTANQLSSWDPYDQNLSSPFFDLEWMFGITYGLDVVIGNPPYIFTRNTDFSEDFKRHITIKYFSLLAQRKIKSRANQSGKINLFALFILRGISDSHENGTLCYIVPNNLLRATTYDLIRKYLLENSKVEEIVDLGSGIFDNVTASTIVFRISKSKINKNHRPRIITNISDLEKREFNASEIPQSQFLKNESYNINIFSDSNIEAIISRLNKSPKYLKDDFEICAGGIATGRDKTESISDRKINEKYKPLIEGKDVKAFFINYRGLFIEYDRKKLHRAREEFVFLLPEKLVTQRIGGGENPLVVAYDDKQFYTFNSTNTIYSKANSKTQIKYLLAILNSRLLNWFYSTQFSNKSNLTVNISKTFLNKIPIANASREDEDIVVSIVNYILLLKKNILNERPIFFECLIDAMVYELYFPDEIKSSNGAEVLKHLTNLSELKDDWSDEKKLEVIEKVYKEISDPKHPVFIAMEKQKAVPEVRIIEGLPALSEIEGDK